MPPSNTCPQSYVNANNVKSLFLFPVSEAKCISIVKDLKNTKYNANTIPMFVFKIINEIVNHIVKLINNSFATSTFSEGLKLATITPIQKKKRRQTHYVKLQTNFCTTIIKQSI